MREILDDLLHNEPLEPTEAARRAVRPTLRKRFYTHAGVVSTPEGFQVELDGRPVRTPARRILAAPSAAIAIEIAAEWERQGEVINPALMPLTRLANSILDGVADAPVPVADDILRYAGSDLLFYRAGEPQSLVRRQAKRWDPIVQWAREALGARFILAEGVVFVQQPEHAIAALRAALPDDPWTLGALHSITTLTGSALLALAVRGGKLGSAEAWDAAHLDENWQMEQWGRDELEMQRREFRWREMEAAALVVTAATQGQGEPPR